MATQTLNTRIALKSDTTANWAKSTLVLLKGEQAIEITESGAYKIKIGDGVKTFAELPYATMTPEEISALIGDTGVYLDTTAGKLVATTFAGALQGNATTATSAAACTGNAASATKLAASRNFSLTGGAVADAVAFNGGGNVALSVKSLNTDYLTNGANTLILNCGTSV